jgi:predicted nucleotidyltransferase
MTLQIGAESRLDLFPEITRRILTVCKPENIILFGSYARGDYHPDSDLDILVILKGITSTRAESNRLRRALRGLLTPIDILVATPEQIQQHRQTLGLIYRPALEEGIVIYKQP